MSRLVAAYVSRAAGGEASQDAEIYPAQANVDLGRRNTHTHTLFPARK